MFLCDTNVWLALALSGHGHHLVARDWLDSIREPASLIVCRATQQSFLRLLTNATVLGAYGNPPLTNRQAWEVYEAILADDRVVFRADEPPGLEGLWRQFSTGDEASPKLWMDAYLAAFAVSGACTIVTSDRAYRQFAGLDLLILGSV